MAPYRPQNLACLSPLAHQDRGAQDEICLGPSSPLGWGGGGPCTSWFYGQDTQYYIVARLRRIRVVHSTGCIRLPGRAVCDESALGRRELPGEQAWMHVLLCARKRMGQKKKKRRKGKQKRNKKKRKKEKRRKREKREDKMGRQQMRLCTP